MPELIAKSPLSGIPPVTHAGLRLSEVTLGTVTSIAIFAGQEKPVAKALKPLGLVFPAPNTCVTAGDATLIWTARNQAFLMGIPAPDNLPGAALTDQSDGWAGLRVEGPDVASALMRLFPLDLRPAAFPQGRASRAPMGHMQSVLIRSGAYAFDILVFRSMARTAWHEIEATLRIMAARKALA